MQLKKKKKNYLKSKALHSDCFSIFFFLKFPIQVKEIKTENGSQCILGIVHAGKMMMEC